MTDHPPKIPTNWSVPGDKINYLTIDECLAALRCAFIQVYCNEDYEAASTEKWHPGDIATHVSAIVHTFAAFSESLRHEPTQTVNSWLLDVEGRPE